MAPVASPFEKLWMNHKQPFGERRHHDPHERLLRVLCLVPLGIETGSVVVHLVEDTGKVDREVGRTITAVWSPAAIRDVGFVVRRVGILSIPAALEVLGDKQ